MQPLTTGYFWDTHVRSKSKVFLTPSISDQSPLNFSLFPNLKRQLSFSESGNHHSWKTQEKETERASKSKINKKYFHVLANLAAEIFHQGGSNKYLVSATPILSRKTEDCSSRLDAFRSPRELHVLDEGQRWIDGFNGNEFFVNGMNLRKDEQIIKCKC